MSLARRAPPRPRLVYGASLAASLGQAATALADTDEPRGAAPIPEPIVTETVTDIDGHEAGEYEVEATVMNLRPLGRGGYRAVASAELEWLVTSRLGFRMEPSFAHELDGQLGDATNEVGGSLAVSWKLFHDFRRNVHVQLEAVGRLPWRHEVTAEPGEPALPVAFDLPVAVRGGAFVVRGAVGWGVGGVGEHAPVRSKLALLTDLGPSHRFGFWGIELDADGARRAPFVVALDVVPDLTPLGLPFQFGVALPWTIGAHSDEPSLGLMFRLIFESEREARYGKSVPAGARP